MSKQLSYWNNYKILQNIKIAKRRHVKKHIIGAYAANEQARL